VIELTAAQIAGIVGGVLHGDVAEQRVVSVVVDSREAIEGAMFVAIEGERVDGHDFASAACAAGAIVVLAQQQLAVPHIRVPDTVLALGALARHARAQLTDCAVIAITGSSGKTSTKDLLAQLLQEQGPTIAPHGSFNTEVGVPLTILRASLATRFLIVEMGMRGIGHIAYLCDIAAPTIAVLLNVGSAHLGMLGTRADVAQAKGEIIAALPATATAIVNADDALALGQAGRTSAGLLTFGHSAAADVRATQVRLDHQARAGFVLHHDGRSAAVQLRVHGEHFVSNALAVAAVALVVGIPLDEVAKRLSRAQIHSRWRMEITQAPGGVTIVNDAYNANPESMRAALATLAAMAQGHRTWAVLGPMLELGSGAEREHAELGRQAARMQVARLVCIGEDTRATQAAAEADERWQGQSWWVADADAAIALVDRELARTDIVLIKASRGIGLERVAAALGEWDPQ